LTEDFLHRRLKERNEKGLLRKLSAENGLIDFSSNDYLGFARSEVLSSSIELEIKKRKGRSGSTGSRLLTGNTGYCEVLEKSIAQYHNAEAGLIFNSGYDANLGLISAVGKQNDLILYDELSHASIYDGVRLSKADSFPFRHNDLLHLEERLKFFKSNHNGTSNCFVIVESVYSMDGDFSPLKEIASLCSEYNASLVVDEAHATGVFGTKGEGRAVELNMQDKVFARVHTFGKALGCHGAIVLGSLALREYLINFSRSFIYTTALPFHAISSIKCAYAFLNNSSDKILKINSLIDSFRSKITNEDILGFMNSYSPVQSLVIEGNENVKRVAALIEQDGFDVRPILSPTVQKGKERIRICLHEFNTEKEIAGLISSIKKSRKFAEQQQLTIR
jgi:8-amino-7-oxononanoate synthase